MDSRETRHLTFDKQQLRNYRSVEPGTTVTFANGHQRKAVGQREVLIQSSTTQLELQNVVHVPEATVNVFSVKRAVNNLGFRSGIKHRDSGALALAFGTSWV